MKDGIMNRSEFETKDELRRFIRTSTRTRWTGMLLWAAYAIGIGLASIAIAFGRLRCLFGRHAPGVHSGKIEIYRLDRDRHAIEYGNVLRCPRCGARTGVDNSH
jgi:hypothetical protein